MGLGWEQKLEPGHTKLRKKLVGAYGGSREAWYESKVQYPFLTGLSGGYVHISEEAARYCRSLAHLHSLGMNGSVTLPALFLSRVLLKSVQLLSCPVKPSKFCEGLTTQGEREQFSLSIHQG